jgi:hypothetical protein
MNIFDFRRQLIADYAAYTRSFIQIRDRQIREYVSSQLEAGVLWPDSLIQLNPSLSLAPRLTSSLPKASFIPSAVEPFVSSRSRPAPGARFSCTGTRRRPSSSHAMAILTC